jgi:iron(II)-dependent oxidoreductase
MQTMAADLAGLLLHARRRTLQLTLDLTDAQLLGPRLPIVNPPLWEIGHLAWFQEKWVLRHLRGERPLLQSADDLYDSARIPHDARWSLPLPGRAQTLAYMQKVLDRVLSRLGQRPPTPEEFYFHHLVAFHEDMHDEAFTYTRQTLGYAPPPVNGQPVGKHKTSELSTTSEGLAGPADADVPGGEFLLGAPPEAPFVFDNEKWAHKVYVAPFAISRTKVTNGEFLRFVEEDGYSRPEFWSDSGRRWRETTNARHPIYWLRGGDGQWTCRTYDRPGPLLPRLPVIHVNWFEADAYCRWARRRLPTEAEWELAASVEAGKNDGIIAREKRRYPWGNTPPDAARAHLDCRSAGCLPVDALPAGDSACGCRQMIGNAWEWTASDFEPFPGFTPDPYKEYSQPWFGGTHKVLRGGAYATSSRLVRNTFRNFFTPDRRDVLAGFRTCQL